MLSNGNVNMFNKRYLFANDTVARVVNSCQSIEDWIMFIFKLF